MEVLRNLPKNELFDVVIADPPYNIGKNFGTNKDNRPLSDYVKWCETWIELCLSRLADNGILYCYGFPEILSHVAVLFPINQQRWLQWHYTNKTVPKSFFWQRSHESILCLWSKKRPRLNVDAIREPYQSSMMSKIEKGIQGQRHEGNNPFNRGRFGDRRGKRTLYMNYGGAAPRDVIKESALSGGVYPCERWFFCRTCKGAFPHDVIDVHEEHDVYRHPTRKPMRLTRRLLLSRCKPGDRVLIPFSGSGSECIIANMMGINYLGIEINPEYVMFSRDWLSKVSTEKIWSC